MKVSRRLALASGIVSSALYVTADIAAARRYPGYRYRDQWVSELMATRAPTRPLLVAAFAPYNALIGAFAAGVWASPPPHVRASRITGAMLAAYAAFGMAGLLLFPMDRRGDPATRRGTMHGPATIALSMPLLGAMVTDASMHGPSFRRYTCATLALVVVFGAWTGRDVPRLLAGEPTPWSGAKERVNIYATMLWIAVLAALLMHGEALRPNV
jgi:hypothetical protein